MMKRLHLATALLATLFGAACSNPVSDAPDTGAQEAGLDAGLHCRSDEIPCGAVCCAVDQSCTDELKCCVPECSSRHCGDDGCGGSCGRCNAGQTCSNGSCVACTPDCTGKVCGSNGCGGVCGSCPTGMSCTAAGQCFGTCTPQCAGKSCGPDGCNTGGTCGKCQPGQTCDGSGQCQGTACKLGGTSCSTYAECCSQECSAGTCSACQPEGEKCGAGCCGALTCVRGLCSSCKPQGATCTSYSECCSASCAGGVCGAGCPGPGASCTSPSGCCSDLQCLSSSCCAATGVGCSSAGECCSGSCTANVCDCGTLGEACLGSGDCCSKVCKSGLCAACTPQCTGKQCGDDGCGGQCGSCSSGLKCNASGKCVQCTADADCKSISAGHWCDSSGNCQWGCLPAPNCGSNCCPGGQVCNTGSRQCVTAGRDAGTTPTETSCNNGLDDDHDGYYDCEDTDCASSPACGGTTGDAGVPPPVCDGAQLCYDINCCMGTSYPCGAGCLCVGFLSCSAQETTCNDGQDNDGDGVTDCRDPDCSGLGGCAAEGNCGNSIDDDLDGFTDCNDADCADKTGCCTEVTGACGMLLGGTCCAGLTCNDALFGTCQ